MSLRLPSCSRRGHIIIHKAIYSGRSARVRDGLLNIIMGISLCNEVMKYIRTASAGEGVSSSRKLYDAVAPLAVEIGYSIMEGD